STRRQRLELEGGTENHLEGEAHAVAIAGSQPPGTEVGAQLLGPAGSHDVALVDSIMGRGQMMPPQHLGT
ncbi:unnamed protein product, partial [Amoebophrya sp. A25]